MDRVVDYFAVTGLCSELTDQNIPYAETRDHFLDIVDICIVLRPEECAPHGFTILNKSMTGVELDKINKISKSVKNSRMFLCCRVRKQNCMNDKPGITQIRIVVSETKKTDGFDEIISTTCGGQDANFGTPQSPMYIAIKRESKCNQAGLDEEPIIQKLDIVNEYPIGNQMFTDSVIVSKTLWSSPVYLAFRRVASVGICDLELPSTVIDVCPVKEHVDFPLPREALPLFSFPEGLRVKRCILSNVPVPKHFSYVMTMADDSKVYVSSILFYEPLESEPEITILNKMNTKKKKSSLYTTTPTAADSKSDDNSTNIIALTKKSSRLFRHSQFLLAHTIPPPTSSPMDDVRGSAAKVVTQHQKEEEEEEEEDKEVEEDGPSNILLSRRLSSMIRLKGIQKHIHGIKGVDPHSEAAGGHLITWVPKTISVLSHWPLYAAFREWLAQLYQMSLSASELPLERLVSYFVLQCPLPSPGGPSLTLRLNCHSRQQITLKLPKLQALPLFDLSFVTIFRSLSVHQVLTTYCTLLLEKKVLLSSRRASIITEVCESLRILLFPIKCEFCYVPRLHSYLLDIMESPGGGLLGVEDLTPLGGQTPNYILANGMAPQCLLELILERMPDEMTYIDLDKHEVHPPRLRENRAVDIDGFLRKDRSAIFLQNQLQKLLDDSLIRVSKTVAASEDCAFVMAETPDMLGDSEEVRPLDTEEVRALFLGLMVDLLYGYTDHLVPPSYDWRTSGVDWFNTESFLSQCEKTKRAFLTEVTKTQSFSSFIQRRTADSDHRLVFFDRCMEQKKLSKEKSKDSSAYPEKSSSSSGGGGGGWQGLLFAARGKPALPSPEEEQDFEIVGFGGERRRAISTGSSSFGKDRDRDISSHGDDNSGDISSYSSHGGLFAMGSLVRSSSSVNKEKIILPGPDRSGLPEGQVFSYIKVSTGLLCWPKLNPDWFLPAVGPAATTTAASCASMILGNLSELLTRDSHQLQLDVVSRKADNISDIRASGSATSLTASPQQLHHQQHQHRPSVLIKLSNSVANLTQSPESLAATSATANHGRLSRSSSNCSGGSDTVEEKYFLQSARDMGRDVYGIWFMFVPALMDTHPAPHVLSLALGALLKMATQDHLCPDEIILRSLILSCGKGGADYRDDAYQLFQLLGQLKIKPDAVTYGLFTQALSTEWHDSGVHKAMTPRSTSASEKIPAHSSPHRSSGSGSGSGNGSITIPHSASLTDLSLHRFNSDMSATATPAATSASNSLSNFLDPLSLLLLTFGKRWKASKTKSALLTSRLDDDICMETKPSMAATIGSRLTSDRSSPMKSKVQSIAAQYSRSHDNNDQDVSTTSTTSSASCFPVKLPDSAGVCMTVCRAVPLVKGNADSPSPSPSKKGMNEEASLHFGDLSSSSSSSSTSVSGWWLAGRVATLGLVTSTGDWISGSDLDDQMMARWAMDAATAASSSPGQGEGQHQVQVSGLRLRYEWMAQGLTRPRSCSDDFDGFEDSRDGRTDSAGSFDSGSRPDHMDKSMHRDRDRDRDREVPYLSPTMLRLNFENALLTHGNQVFFLSFIIENCPELFWNICWYSARLGLPLPFIGVPATNIEAESETTDSAPAATAAAAARGARRGGSESEDGESVSTLGRNDRTAKEAAATGGPLVVVCSYDPLVGRGIAAESLRTLRVAAYELMEGKSHATKPPSPPQLPSDLHSFDNEVVEEVDVDVGPGASASAGVDLNKNDSTDNQNEKYKYYDHDTLTPVTYCDITGGEVDSEDCPIRVADTGRNCNNIQWSSSRAAAVAVEPTPPSNFVRPAPLSGLSKRLSFSLTGATANTTPTTSPTLPATSASTSGTRRSSLRPTRLRRDDEAANLAAKALSMKQQQQQQISNIVNPVKSSKEINAAHDALRKKKERTWSILEEVKSSVSVSIGGPNTGSTTTTTATTGNHDSHRDAAAAAASISGVYAHDHNLSSASSGNTLGNHDHGHGNDNDSSPTGAASATRQIFGQYMHRLK